jgi:C4-dicarboxylate-specific signal transduction histidine kinase
MASTETDDEARRELSLLRARVAELEPRPRVRARGRALPLQARKKQAGAPDALAHYEYRIINKNGELRWTEQFSRSIEYGGRPADFITIIDITARKQAEASLSQLATSLEQAAKLEALGVLAAGIAHDFNNLLGGPPFFTTKAQGSGLGLLPRTRS